MIYPRNVKNWRQLNTAATSYLNKTGAVIAKYDNDFLDIQREIEQYKLLKDQLKYDMSIRIAELVQKYSYKSLEVVNRLNQFQTAINQL